MIQLVRNNLTMMGWFIGLLLLGAMINVHLANLALVMVGIVFSVYGLLEERKDWRVAKAMNGQRQALAEGHIRNELIRLVILIFVGIRLTYGGHDTWHGVFVTVLLTYGSIYDQRQLDWIRRTGGSKRDFKRRVSDVVSFSNGDEAPRNE